MHHKFKVFISTCLLLSVASFLFAIEEYVSNIYKEIDKVFVEKSEELLNTVLQKYQDDKNYYLIENYAQKKVRRLILNDEYPFAMSAIIVIIENNLDNEEALEMYSVISDAVEEQKRQQLALLEQQQKEEVRVEQLKEKQRGSVEKEYVAAATTTGKSVYITGAETKTTNNFWNVNLGMLSFGNLVDASIDPVLSGFNYGLSTDFYYVYSGKDKSFGCDLAGNIQFLSFGDTAESIPFSGEVEFAPKIAFNGLLKKLFFRLGMAAVFTGKSAYTYYSDTSTLENFYSPLVGFAFENLKIGKNFLTIGVDYLAGHLMYDNVNFSAGARAMFTIPFAETEKFNMTLNMGVKEQLFVKPEGIENRASVILAIGATNVN